MVTELVCKGRIKYNDLEKLFTGRIENNSILYTDSHKSYIKFAVDFGLEHYRIKRGRHIEGI